MECSAQVWKGGVLYGLDSEVVRDRREGGGSWEMFNLHTDLLGQNNGSLLALGRSQNCCASLQLLLLLLGVGQLETFLLLQTFLTYFHSRDDIRGLTVSSVQDTLGILTGLFSHFFSGTGYPTFTWAGAGLTTGRL